MRLANAPHAKTVQGAGRRLKFELQGKNRQRNHSEMFFETAGEKN